MAAPRQADGYERSDADPRLIAAIAAGTAAFVALVPLTLRAAYPSVARPAQFESLPQPPQLIWEITPRAALAASRSHDAARLTGYGWIDRQQGTVRIPIDRASEILAKRGLPGWPVRAAGAP